MFRERAAKLQQRKFIDLFMPDDREIMVPNILHITRENHEFEGEVMLRRPDKTTFLGMISGTYFHWENDQEGMAFSIHDLTDMKAIERSLRHSERVAFLGHLVDDISHQIRNPVMVIGGLAKRLATTNSSQKKVEAIMNEANRLEQLLDTLNSFINLRCPEQERFLMGNLINIAETTFRHKVEEYGCIWVSEYEENLTNEELLIDKDLILDAFEAAIVNACESYSGKTKGDIIFQIRRSCDFDLPFVVSIIDHGVGIPSEILPLISGHFYSTKTRHTGMGLTLAQKIVEEQRGTLAIASEVGVGTTVNFHLVKERRRPIRTIKLQ